MFCLCLKGTVPGDFFCATLFLANLFSHCPWLWILAFFKLLQNVTQIFKNYSVLLVTTTRERPASPLVMTPPRPCLMSWLCCLLSVIDAGEALRYAGFWFFTPVSEACRRSVIGDAYLAVVLCRRGGRPHSRRCSWNWLGIERLKNLSKLFQTDLKFLKAQ